jgi:hypothetical protein
MEGLPIYIVDEIGAIVQATDQVLSEQIGRHTGYMYGHPLDIEKRLQDMATSPDLIVRSSRFPMVVLFQDFAEQMGTQSGIYTTTSLNLVIVTNSEQNWNSEERYDKNFRPLLYPIYGELIRQVDQAGLSENSDKIRHRKYDRVFWSVSNKNPFNEYIDAIEIQSLEVKFKTKYF